MYYAVEKKVNNLRKRTKRGLNSGKRVACVPARWRRCSLRGADTVTGDDGVEVRVIYNRVEEGGVTCLVSGREKDVGDSTIRADGFELRPVDHAKGLQTVHILLETE